jgi:hypothetical protein
VLWEVTAFEIVAKLRGDRESSVNRERLTVNLAPKRASASKTDDQRQAQCLTATAAVSSSRAP